MAGYLKCFNIEMDPHEDHDVAVLFIWSWQGALKQVEEYQASVKKYPNPPAPNITKFEGRMSG
jgi:arylsulfatase